MKYHSHILKEKQKINQKVKEIDERILILKKSIENDRRNTKIGRKSKRQKKINMSSLPVANKPTSKPYSAQYNHKNRKLLDNLSSDYDTRYHRNSENYQRNKALIMAGIAILIITWVIYSLKH
jgi:hypothetical protein